MCVPRLLLQAALPHMKEGASIINTSSVTAYKGSPKLVDYSATKGAQVGASMHVYDALLGKQLCAFQGAQRLVRHHGVSASCAQCRRTW